MQLARFGPVTEVVMNIPVFEVYVMNVMSWESNYRRGEVQGIEVWRKSSKSAVK